MELSNLNIRLIFRFDNSITRSENESLVLRTLQLTMNVYYARELGARPPPHDAKAIWKQRFQCENASNVFRASTQRRRKLKTRQTPVDHFGFVFKENSAIKKRDYCRNAPFSKFLPSSRVPLF